MLKYSVKNIVILNQTFQFYLHEQITFINIYLQYTDFEKSKYYFDYEH